MSLTSVTCRPMISQQNAVSRLLPRLLAVAISWTVTGDGPRTWASTQTTSETPSLRQREPTTGRSVQEHSIVLKSPRWEITPTGTRANLRGLHASDKKHVWVCGSDGVVLRSENGGESWIDCSPAGFEQLEFRAIQTLPGGGSGNSSTASERLSEGKENGRAATPQLPSPLLCGGEGQGEGALGLDAEPSLATACIASAGTPAVILKTTDGGFSWREVYRREGSTAFFNGLKFYDRQHGLAFSDPLAGRMLIVETTDGGDTWQEVAPENLPPALPGEVGFAASNTALVLQPIGAEAELPAAWIGVGGAARDSSRVYLRPPGEAEWQVAECPLRSGPSQGIFSLAVGETIETIGGPELGERQRATRLTTEDAPVAETRWCLVAVGGDYREETNARRTAAYSFDLGRTWHGSPQPPGGYRSCVVALPKPCWLPVLDVRDSDEAAGEALGSADDATEALQRSGYVRMRFLTVGTTGTDYSVDGRHWSELNDQGFHVAFVIEDRVYAAGAEGRFARLQTE